MDNVGDILYIVIGIVVLLFNIFGNKKTKHVDIQKESLPNDTPNKGRKTFSLENTFKELKEMGGDFGEFFKEVEHEEAPVTKSITTSSHVAIPHTIPHHVLSNTAHTAVASTNTVVAEIIDEEQESPFTFEQSELRKAVIYSEIINRKYT